MARVTSAFFVSALVRRAMHEGAFAALVRRGAEEAGVVFVLVDRLDGSVDLYIQNESPGKGKESNWLPAPKGEFILMMRLYWPKEQAPSLLDGSWQVPPVKEAN